MKENTGFTLLELIIVIVIIGILATLGYTQYTNVVEHGRGAEARTNLGFMRKLAMEYFFKNNSLLSISATDVGIGSAVPSSCTSTNHFYYTIGGWHTAGACDLIACRCTSGGKAPQAGTPGTIIYTVRVNDTSRWDGQTATDGFTFWQASECGCTSCQPIY